MWKRGRQCKLCQFADSNKLTPTASRYLHVCTCVRICVLRKDEPTKDENTAAVLILCRSANHRINNSFGWRRIYVLYLMDLFIHNRELWHENWWQCTLVNTYTHTHIIYIGTLCRASASSARHNLILEAVKRTIFMPMNEMILFY